MEGKLREMKDSMKRFNTCLIGLKSRGEKEWTDVIFEEITGENVPRLMKGQ